MKILNFTIYFDEKTNRIRRIFVHSAWCDYNCENCPHKSLCDRIHDAIEVLETPRCSDCAFVAIKAGRVWCGLTCEITNLNRQACKNFRHPKDVTAEEIAELNSKPWNRNGKKNGRWSNAR